MKNILLKTSFLLFAILFTTENQAKVNDSEGYAFGYATCLGDSCVYITDIQHLNGVSTNKKTGFIELQKEYAHEMELRLKDIYAKHFTCAFFYSTNKKKLEKKFLSIRKTINKSKENKLEYITNDVFSFTPIIVSTQTN